MKRRLLTIGMLFLLLGVGTVWAQDDIHKHSNCSYCGMDRAKFAHSRMLIVYDDQSEFGACSLHCAAIDLAVNMDKGPVRIGVGDYGTRKLIDAEQAIWVLGGGKQGVMTGRAKWAFEKQADAKRFVEENGGEIIGFEKALEAAYEDMYKDTRMIREKRKMKRMRMKHKKDHS